jgi:hypothetical protein
VYYIYPNIGREKKIVFISERTVALPKMQAFVHVCAGFLSNVSGHIRISRVNTSWFFSPGSCLKENFIKASSQRARAQILMQI